MEPHGEAIPSTAFGISGRNQKIYTNKTTIKNILGAPDGYLCKVRLDF